MVPALVELADLDYLAVRLEEGSGRVWFVLHGPSSNPQALIVVVLCFGTESLFQPECVGCDNSPVGPSAYALSSSLGSLLGGITQGRGL